MFTAIASAKAPHTTAVLVRISGGMVNPYRAFARRATRPHKAPRAPAKPSRCPRTERPLEPIDDEVGSGVVLVLLVPRNRSRLGVRPAVRIELRRGRRRRHVAGRIRARSGV